MNKLEQLSAIILAGLVSWDYNNGKMLCERDTEFDKVIEAVSLAKKLIKECEE